MELDDDREGGDCQICGDSSDDLVACESCSWLMCSACEHADGLCADCCEEQGCQCGDNLPELDDGDDDDVD